MLPDILRVLQELSLNLDALLNRGLRPDLNWDARLVSVTSHGTPGTEFSVAHGLGKEPEGYFVYGQAGAGSLYDGVTADTRTTLYLRSDAASTEFRIIVF
jgi:hypothetical protein